MEILTAPDGTKYYEAPHEPREAFTIRVKSDGVFHSVTCDQEPGLHLGGVDLTLLLADFERAVKLLRELNGGPAELVPAPSTD